MRNVYSSHVSQIGYDEDKQQLVVQWQRGKVSAYDGVPPELAQQIMNAPSIGRALRASIIGVYDHSYLEG